jgi:hypothetical protein
MDPPRYKQEGIAVWHIPQLQLEMLCAGNNCRSAVLITLTALHGAKLFTIQRDDAYILEMMRWLSKFYTRYIRSNPTQRPVPTNFFDPDGNLNIDSMNADGDELAGLEDEDKQDYANFLAKTAAIAKAATISAKIPQSEVQRSKSNAHFFHK